MISSPPASQRIEVRITPNDEGAELTPDDAIRAVEETLRVYPCAPGDLFVFLGMEYPDVDTVMAAVRALQPLWE
jgi:hypothetical protein